MKSIKYLFLMFILILSFTTISCKKAHEHEYIDGYCSCGESNKSEFRITFVDHEGTIIKEQYVTKNSAATAPTLPIRYGYEFIGWNCDFSNINKDLIISPKYNKIEYVKVTFDADNDTVVNVLNVSFNTPVIEPSAPSKEGYGFLGWYKDNVKWDFTKNIDEDIILTAKWAQFNMYDISYAVDGGTLVDNAPSKYIEGVGIETLPTISKKGYDFLGWFINDVKVESISAESTGAVVLTAKWNICSYTLTYNLNGGKGNIITLTQEYGSFIERPIIPYKQYAKFIGWNMDIPLYMPDYDITVEAIWEENEFLEKCIYRDGEYIQYNGTDSEIVIPFSLYENEEKMTYVPNNILKDNKYIRKITIDEGYKGIGPFAFAGCDNLESLILADSLLYISHYKFQEFSELKYNIYDGACYLGTPSNPYHLVVKLENESVDSLIIHKNTLVMASLDYFSKVENLIIPEKLEYINESAEYTGKCVIKNGVKYIGPVSNPYKFVIGLESRDVEVVTINENSKMIIPIAFMMSKIKTLTIPNGVVIIGEEAFFGCSNLESLYIPSSVNYVGSHICSWTKATIYCDFETKPSTWCTYWNYDGSYYRPVIWNN